MSDLTNREQESGWQSIMVGKAASDESARFRLGRAIRTAVPRHELDFICKVGRIDHAEALALLQKHMGDREAVFSELVSRQKR